MDAKQVLDLDPNEQVIFNVRRHYIGLLAIYLSAIIIEMILLATMFLIINIKDKIGLESISDTGVTTIFAVLLVIGFIGAIVAARIYRNSQLVLTNENIILVVQFGLFNRQVSQLNLAKVQDVSADQIGILASMFGFGAIDVETAGEAANFHFNYIHDPNKLAKQIIEAHQVYVQTHKPDTNVTV